MPSHNRHSSSSRTSSPSPSAASNSNPPQSPPRVQPEQMSLDAHAHIQALLGSLRKTSLSKEDLNAVLRLSQHLRVFGLLSAVGYINQSNEHEGKVSERISPIWRLLINQLLAPQDNLSDKALMEKVVATSRTNATEYMINWRKALQISNHWNFWARAYSDN